MPARLSLTITLLQPLVIASLTMLWAATASAASLPEPLQDLHDESTRYQPACALDELRRLEPALREAAAGRQADEAWRLTRALLCGNDAKSIALALRHMPERVLDDSYQTGEEAPVRHYRPRSAGMLARAQAWDAQASAAEQDLLIAYRCSEVCMASFRLRLVAGHWLLAGISQAVD